MTKPAWENRIIGEGAEAPDQLLANPQNYRRHPKTQKDALAGALDEIGWIQRVIVNQRTGQMVDGHARVELAIARGEPAVPVVYVDLSEEEERIAIATIDPIAGLAYHDEEQLGELLSQVSAESEDLQAFLDGLGPEGGDTKTGNTDPDDVPETHEDEPPVSARGDVWQLGAHRLMCGDSTAADDVGALMDGDTADMVFTDPPYGVSYVGTSASKSIAGDITQAAIPIAFKQAVEIATNKDARVYFFGGSSNVGMYYSLFDAYLRSMPTLIIWDKGQIVLRRNNYHSQYEVIFYGWKGRGGSPDHWYGGRGADDASDVWAIKRDSSNEYLHPTQKPVALAERAIRNSCPPGGKVYEPFSGSASTIIGCEKTMRACCAMEMDPRFTDTGIRRWQDFTGEEAVLESTGQTFTEVKRERVGAAA